MADSPQTVRVEFDARIYSLDVIQRAALKFTDRCSFNFSLPHDQVVTVDIAPLGKPDIVIADVVARFRNEVLDQGLRERIAKETEAERNLILAYAFSNTKLIQP